MENLFKKGLESLIRPPKADYHLPDERSVNLVTDLFMIAKDTFKIAPQENEELQVRFCPGICKASFGIDDSHFTEKSPVFKVMTV